MIRTRVFGPAYQDDVIRVDRPLLEDGRVDGSFDGRIEDDEGMSRVVDDGDGQIVFRESPWPGEPDRSGRIIRIAGQLRPDRGPWARMVSIVSRSVDLGGMGAGFAHALGGELVSAIGADAEGVPDSRGLWIADALAARRIAHRPILVRGKATDWTLIVSSGGHGDKLAVGFRGCHAAIGSLDSAVLTRPCDLLVVAGLPNALAARAMAVPARVRLFAPAMRNMADRVLPLGALAGRFNVLSGNRREWEALADPAVVLGSTPIVAVTDGPDGCVLHYLAQGGGRSRIAIPAFPRDDPPRDTNRAGEAFAATLVATLMDAGWAPGPAADGLIRLAGLRASAASALVLDREDFGFPAPEEIDLAVRVGKVAGGGDRPRG